MKVIATNRKARHEFEILERVEAGLVLRGTEVKSIRDGNVGIAEAHARFRAGELFLVGARIEPYNQGNVHNHDPDRPRKLLLHRREILKLEERMEQKGLTVIPLRLYFTARGHAKVELGVCRGLKRKDRRDVMRAREAKREMERGYGRGEG